MSNKNLFAAATLFGCAVTVLAHAATADAAASKKAKPSAPKAASSKVMMCEGVAAGIVTNAYAGTNRSENNIAFGIRMNPATSEIAIMGVQGSRIIKAGRHALERDGAAYAVSIPWKDNNNAPQTLVLRFDRKGNFSGTTQESMANNAGVSLICGFMPGSCDALLFTITHEYKGVCWDSK